MANTIAFLTVEIKGTNYGVETFLAETTLNKVVRLSKIDGTSYDVEQGWDRTTCTCPDYQRRHADLPYSDGCKHVRSLVSLSLIENVTPWTASEPKTVEVVEAAHEETHAGLALAVAELADDATDAEKGKPVRRKPGRKPISDTINWDSFGRRYAAGESRSVLAAEAGVSPTRFWNRVTKLGYSSPKNHYHAPKKGVTV
ncbi:hypothetical protein V5E97_06900 [Singulisphaera sp. Ch08]|uniref:SWIM-type domain-containing protein n=1 Tax=Singulisphaera sp. Ch08 TaxID=3120278 RepID=A0AAU7CLD0_9BACT